MATVDPYRLLQVHPEADAEIIQVAYRKLAQRYHPDVAPGPEAARLMAELNAARDLLADPAARAALDRSRATAPTADGHTGSGASRSAASAGSDHASTASGPATGPVAGPRPGTPSGSVLAFGRYAGWSLGEVARQDIDYVEWLDRMPIGRPYRAEIDVLLRGARRRGGAASPEEPHGLYRRR